MAENVARRFSDEFRFFRTWFGKPKAIGSVLPTSSVTAKSMASVIDCESDDPVLELGPGTGIVTKAILARGVRPENLHSIEFAEEFIPRLRSDFPGVNFIHGDAFQLGKVLPDMNGRKIGAVISTIPLLNYPVERRVQFLNGILEQLNPGRPVVQMSYGAVSPIPPDKRAYSTEPLDWIVRNVPPVRLWVFRKILE